MKNILKLVGVGGLLAILFFSTQSFSQNVKLNPILPGVKSSGTITDEQQGILAVRKIKPSVVNIVGEKTGPFAESTIFGTGFVYTSDGYIISNNHVVSDSEKKYYVVFADGSEYDARVVGLDKFNDVALIKIEKKGLTPAVLGNSDILETGQTVFAVGNSLGKYQNTVSKGVVSGLDRALEVGTSYDPKPRMLNLIQTDAAINPGNSGGPLINMAGEVVGMNTLIDQEGRGLGFAVPVTIIKQSVEQLKAFGKASRAYMGVQYVTVNKSIQALRSLSTSDGAFISFVAPNAPASLAGIQPGDVIVEINREKLTQQRELDTIVSKFKAGDQILIALMRSTEKIETTVILVEYK